ncbi:NlpC/P60 family protein [Aestuariispira insulae]|uniref:NlpC/P60 family protein n=2 Tax=Aestuariispira insulae TaxID=1461337 RepID=A0A3D9HPU7_9PROT|nr:NlpC/P60 family protein [Aestuariispira insulae]
MELRDDVVAERYTEGSAFHVTAPVVSLRRGPGFEFPQDSQLLFGDNIRCFEEKDGWAWVQNNRDGYVGYCPSSDLNTGTTNPTHLVSSAFSLIFPEPDIKRHPIFTLSLGSHVEIIEKNEKFSKLANGGWVYSRHLASRGVTQPDLAETASKFLESPYLWGGNSYLGLDCSGLVQLALLRAGIMAKRDTDQQEYSVGESITINADHSGLKRNDLVFWPGHVGIMMDDSSLIHANATDMKTSIAPLEKVSAHIKEIEGTEISSIRRLEELA